MTRLPPASTRTDKLLPYTTLCRGPDNGRVCCGLLLTARWSVVRLGGVPKGFLISLLTHWPPRSSMRLRRWPSSSNRRRLLPSIHRQRPATHPPVALLEH